MSFNLMSSNLMSSNLIIKILAFLFIIYFCYLAFLDYKYREVKRRLVLFAYPFVFYVNWQVTEFKMILIFSSIILALTLYISALRKPNSFGAIDILFAPLVTIWFNEWSFVYSLALIIINSIFWKIGVVDRFFKQEGKPLTNPYLVTMLEVFFVFLIITPNNFHIIFSL